MRPATLLQRHGSPALSTSALAEKNGFSRQVPRRRRAWVFFHCLLVLLYRIFVTTNSKKHLCRRSIVAILDLAILDLAISVNLLYQLLTFLTLNSNSPQRHLFRLPSKQNVLLSKMQIFRMTCPRS